MKKYICRLIYLLPYFFITSVHAGGWSWYRHIYNTSMTTLGIMMVNSSLGNFYVTCNGETYKNPYMTFILPGQTCATKMTTTGAKHFTALAFFLPEMPEPENSLGHMFYLEGDNRQSTYWLGFTGDVVDGNAPRIAGTLVLDGFPMGDPRKIIQIGSAGGDIWLFAQSNLKSWIDGGIPYLIPVDRQSSSNFATIYNYVKFPITFDGTATEGNIKFTGGELADYALDEEFTFVPNTLESAIEFGSTKQSVTVSPAKVDYKGNLIPGGAELYYNYHPEFGKKIRGYYEFFDAQTNKIKGFNVNNFTIDGGKFEYWVNTSAGIQKVRVIFNAAPYEEGHVAQSDGSMIICPVGFPDLDVCQ